MELRGLTEIAKEAGKQLGVQNITERPVGDVINAAASKQTDTAHKLKGYWNPLKRLKGLVNSLIIGWANWVHKFGISDLHKKTIFGVISGIKSRFDPEGLKISQFIESGVKNGFLKI